MADGIVIRPAVGPIDYAAFGRLCGDYGDWCRARYADMPWFVAEVFGHQALDAELASLPERYGPPAGRALIAERDGAVVAGGAYRRQQDGICELKRLYASDRARGLGLGRRLTEALMAAARADGFRVMRLDTGDRFAEATALYESMGFVRVPPFHAYPERLLRHLVFLEARL